MKFCSGPSFPQPFFFQDCCFVPCTTIKLSCTVMPQTKPGGQSSVTVTDSALDVDTAMPMFNMPLTIGLEGKI